jgi:hypothetical protein
MKRHGYPAQTNNGKTIVVWWHDKMTVTHKRKFVRGNTQLE